MRRFPFEPPRGPTAKRSWTGSDHYTNIVAMGWWGTRRRLMRLAEATASAEPVRHSRGLGDPPDVGPERGRDGDPALQPAAPLLPLRVPRDEDRSAGVGRPGCPQRVHEGVDVPPEVGRGSERLRIDRDEQVAEVLRPHPTGPVAERGERASA